MFELSTYYVIRVYLNDIFCGYVKNYRFHRSKKYRFDKTKNVNNASKFGSISGCEAACIKLNKLRDDLVYYNKKFNFKCVELTKQEVRKSKLSFLNIVKIKEGIFKNEIK